MKNFIKKLFSVDDNWFYSNPPALSRFLSIYVKGDLIVIIPFLLLIGFVGLWSVRYMALMFAVFFTLRSFGEMLYWFSHQFWQKQYRPHDFGFKKLGNDAVYILYQLAAMCGTVVGIVVTIYLLLNWL